MDTFIQALATKAKIVCHGAPSFGSEPSVIDFLRINRLAALDELMISTKIVFFLRFFSFFYHTYVSDPTQVDGPRSQGYKHRLNQFRFGR